jgi:hypothetical protein
MLEVSLVAHAHWWPTMDQAGVRSGTHRSSGRNAPVESRYFRTEFELHPADLGQDVATLPRAHNCPASPSEAALMEPSSSRSELHYGYLSAPLASPETKYRCDTMYANITGNVPITVAANA